MKYCEQDKVSYKFNGWKYCPLCRRRLKDVPRINKFLTGKLKKEFECPEVHVCINDCNLCATEQIVLLFSPLIAKLKDQLDQHITFGAELMRKDA